MEDLKKLKKDEIIAKYKDLQQKYKDLRQEKDNLDMDTTS